MPKRKRSPKENKVKRRRLSGISIQSRENQITNWAYDLVAKRIKNGTATSQETTHFLKNGSVIAQLEKEIKQKELQLIEAKTEAIKSQKKVEELYANAMKAFSIYKGEDEEIEDD